MDRTCFKIIDKIIDLESGAMAKVFRNPNEHYMTVYRKGNKFSCIIKIDDKWERREDFPEYEELKKAERVEIIYKEKKITDWLGDKENETKII